MSEINEIKKTSDTKKRIFNAAMRLFAQNGYDATTVRQIAKEAEVSQPSVYWAYKNKKDILNAILNAYWQKVEENLITKEEANRLVEVSTPQQALDWCTDFFSKDQVEFMFLAYKIAAMEQFTNSLAKEIIVGELRNKAVESVKYMLDLLIARGEIPKTNTAFLTELWAQCWLCDATMWVHFSKQGKIEAEANLANFNKQIIELALKGDFPSE